MSEEPHKRGETIQIRSNHQKGGVNGKEVPCELFDGESKEGKLDGRDQEGLVEEGSTLRSTTRSAS